MARPWRIEFEEATYHVVSRGNHRQNIFFANSDRVEFLNLLASAQERFNLKIFAFCLMSNHYHLMLCTPDANLSRAMQWLDTTYSVRIQRRNRLTGHLFQGRFKAALVEDDYHWQRLSYYIHLNPVRAKMVENLSQYEWSSYQDYTIVRPRFDWLSRREVLEAEGLKGAKSRRAYRKTCLALAKKPKESWKDITEKTIIGTEEFVERIKIKFAPLGRKKEEVVDYTRLARPIFDLEAQLERVANTFETEPGLLKQRSKYFPARQAVFLHLVKNCGMKPGVVADYFGVRPAAITNAIGRITAHALEDSALDRKIKSLKSEVL
jgi:putative transposase